MRFSPPSTTENELKEARAWYESLDPEIQKMRAVRLSVERIANDAAWLKNNGKAVTHWLKINASGLQ